MGASPQGCEPIHKRAMRFQSQASFEDSQDICNEEVEGDGQLDGLRVHDGASQHALVDLESLIFGRGGRTHQAVVRALYYSAARPRLLSTRRTEKKKKKKKKSTRVEPL